MSGGVEWNDISVFAVVLFVLFVFYIPTIYIRRRPIGGSDGPLTWLTPGWGRGKVPWEFV